MNVLSLFSGVGGFDLGLEQAGMTTVYQCEWDKHATNILNRHWPHVPKWGDITTLTAQEILRHGTPPDIVAWGSPCQDLSVAGKRAGLDGQRSGLFHEGMRLIRELRKETNNEYPRISIWENVAGALSSNRGADFGIILDEMAQAGAMVIEWSLLDAQHFGIPQRRRRVFVIAIFDSAIAHNCPNPLLPVSESMRRDSAKGKSKRQAASRTLTEGVGGDGAWWDGGDTAEAITTTSDQQRMPDKHRFQAVVVGGEGFASSSFAQYTEGVGTLRSNGGDLGGGSETVIVEPFVKSRRAQSSTDDETWVVGEINPTLNSFDVGDTRATTAILEPLLLDGRRVDDVRVYDPPVQTLQARMGTGGNNVPVIGTLSFDTQFGSNANVFEDTAPTPKASQQSPSVAIPIHDQATRHSGKRGDKADGKGNGLGIGNEGDPMNTLTSGDRHAVAYDEYNDSINDVHHALRAGTKQSTGVLVENDVVGTLRSGGDGGVPSSRGEHLVVEAAGFKPGASANARSIGYEEGLAPSLEAGGGGNNRPAILESTMAVRRLTPLECERLMGWPDDHTRYNPDGSEQADTHRYKQCGNGVASPVARWIAQHILNIPRNPA